MDKSEKLENPTFLLVYMQAARGLLAYNLKSWRVLTTVTALNFPEMVSSISFKKNTVKMLVSMEMSVQNLIY
jgi:hypothetical protein